MAPTTAAIGVVSTVVLALRPEFSTESPNATNGVMCATRREARVTVLTAGLARGRPFSGQRGSEAERPRLRRRAPRTHCRLSGVRCARFGAVAIFPVRETLEWWLRRMRRERGS
jgi:hypothetical protein